MQFGEFFKIVCCENGIHDEGRIALSYLWHRLDEEDVPPSPVETACRDDWERLEGWAEWADALAGTDVLPDDKADDIIPALRAVLCEEIDKTAYSFESLVRIIRGWKPYQIPPIVEAGRALQRSTATPEKSKGRLRARDDTAKAPPLSSSRGQTSSDSEQKRSCRVWTSG